jgi:hypothetical protein
MAKRLLVWGIQTSPMMVRGECYFLIHVFVLNEKKVLSLKSNLQGRNNNENQWRGRFKVQ